MDKVELELKIEQAVAKGVLIDKRRQMFNWKRWKILRNWVESENN